MPEGCIRPGEPLELEEDELRPYRPPNGTEGECFMGKWCAHCVLDAYPEDDPYGLGSEAEFPTCEILGNAMAGFQPDEWVYGRDGIPRCLAFRDSPPNPFWGSDFDPDGAIRLLL